jgi:hypothetical protein
LGGEFAESRAQRAKEQRSLEDKDLLVPGLADSIEEAFKSVLRQQQTEVFVASARKIQKALVDGCCNICNYFVQDRDSI